MYSLMMAVWTGAWYTEGWRLPSSIKAIFCWRDSSTTLHAELRLLSVQLRP